MSLYHPPHATGWDTETHLIGPGQTIPRLVCLTGEHGPADKISPDGGLQTFYDKWILVNADPLMAGHVERMIALALRRETVLIAHNTGFDGPVILRYFWEVMQGTQVGNKDDAEKGYFGFWDLLDNALDDELSGVCPAITDTLIREKLFNLSTEGSIDMVRGRDARYSLADLVKTYFGVDISDKKVTRDQSGRIYDADGNDITGSPAAAAAWRLRFSELDSVPFRDWPTEAANYAIDDAIWARRVYIAQEAGRQLRGPGSMNSQSLQVYADIALRIYADTGFRIDRAQVEKVEAMIADTLNKVEFSLKANGIIRPNGSCNQAILHERVRNAWGVKGMMPMLTDTGRIAAGDEVMTELEGIDPVLDLYSERQTFAKLQNAFLPNLSGERVWSNYDILKETGRTSSYGASEKSKRKPLYPAMNIQQIPKKNGIREIFLPPEPDEQAPRGYVFVSCDYTALELCSIGQVTYSLLGHSVHRDKINDGYDLHTYLAANMAIDLAPHLVDWQHDPDGAYRSLNAKRKVPDSDQDPVKQDHKSQAKNWRNFAKPTGLGYPGGLGPATLVSFAKATYGISMSKEQAETFRDLWRRTYPEMPEFFSWVEGQTDLSAPGEDLYAYETQGYNRWRARATFCATANGKAMQSLSADGAKRSVAWIARACSKGLREDSPYCILGGCMPEAFIHDENIVAIPDDILLTCRSLLVSQLMVRAMQVTMPDVRISVEPAVMTLWTKEAEPVWVKAPGLEVQVEAYLGTPLYELMRKELADTYRPDMALIPWDKQK